MPQPVTLKKLKLNSSVKTYKTLELTPKKAVLFIIADWNAKVGSEETPGVTGKFSPGVRNEAGQRLIEFCQENTLAQCLPYGKHWLVSLGFRFTSIDFCA